MFVALQKQTKEGCHIERLHMDGSGRTHVVEYGLLGPLNLHYDQQLHRVFWCDAGTNNIESTSVDGSSILIKAAVTCINFNFRRR